MPREVVDTSGPVTGSCNDVTEPGDGPRGEERSEYDSEGRNDFTGEESFWAKLGDEL